MFQTTGKEYNQIFENGGGEYNQIIQTEGQNYNNAFQTGPQIYKETQVIVSNYDPNILGNTTTQNTTETFVENAQPIQMDYGQINPIEQGVDFEEYKKTSY